MKIYRVTDPEFLPFGRVLSLDTADIVKEGEKVQMPQNGSVYVASKEEFEKLAIPSAFASYRAEVLRLLEEEA